jgi:hypothetical protein
VLFKQGFWDRLADGTVTLAFRRWKRPTIKPGGALQTPGGVLGIDEVDRIDPSEVTREDARAAGYADRHEALADLRPEGNLYRIRFHRLGDDPRIALRLRTTFDDTEFAELMRILSRLDWAWSTLDLIGNHPGVVSTDLAAHLGIERVQFKLRVRRLKALGLTESLEVGYRLSPRGHAFLAEIDVRTHGAAEQQPLA